MTELMEQAISRIRDLPPEMQDEFAELLLRLAEERDESVYRLTPEEAVDLDAGDDEIARGLFATDEEVEAVLANYTR